MQEIKAILDRIRSDPENPQLLIQLAKKLEHRGRQQNLPVMLEKAHKTWFKVAELLERQGQEGGAEACRRHAIGIGNQRQGGFTSHPAPREITRGLRILNDALSSVERFSKDLAEMGRTISEMRQNAEGFRSSCQVYRSKFPRQETFPASSHHSASPVHAALGTRHNIIAEHLQNCGMYVESVRRRKAVDDHLDQLAGFMGNHFNAIEPVYQQIKRVISGGQRNRFLKINLNQYNEKQISSINQFGDKLHELSFVVYKKYKKRRLNLKISTDALAKHFISGGWLERYVRREIKQALRRYHPISYECASRIVVNLPEISLKRELDLLVAIDTDIFWFEVKTRAPQEDIVKYHQLRKLLHLPPERSFLILESADSIDTAFIDSAYGLQIIPLDRLPDIMNEILKGYSSEQTIDDSSDPLEPQQQE